MKPKVYVIAIFLLVGIGVFSNRLEKAAVDQSKIPEKVEESQGFQRWITNLKNTDFDIEADEFNMIEENEIFNTKWMTVSSFDQPGVEEAYNQRLEEVEDLDKVVYSPSERQYVDYRNQKRYGYEANEVYVYGQREDKVLDARVVDCSTDANCYFDRAWFLEDSNDVVVVSEFARNIPDSDEDPPVCTEDELCEYVIKIHVIDLLRNSRLVYVSKPFDIIFSEIQDEL